MYICLHTFLSAPAIIIFAQWDLKVVCHKRRRIDFPQLETYVFDIYGVTE